MFLTIPTIFTWARIASIPLLVLVFYLPMPSAWQNLAATLLFILFALTDWLDGFLARALQQSSSFGAFLDPVADKLLVTASLLVLLHLDRVNVFVTLIIIGREITVSALREWMAQIGASNHVAVHIVGKVKTAVQMLAIPFLLYSAQIGPWLNSALIGTWLIWLAALLTVWSMIYYLRQATPSIRQHGSRENNKKQPQQTH